MVDSVTERTGGVPLFVEEIAHILSAYMRIAVLLGQHGVTAGRDRRMIGRHR